MADLTAYERVVRAINAQIHPEHRELSCWGSMLTSIALAAGPVERENVRLVSSSLRREAFQIVVVTDSLVIEGLAENALGDSPTFSVNAYALSRLVSISFKEAGDVFNRGFGSDWPGRLRVKLEHEDAGPVLLPLPRDDNSLVFEQLEALLPDLMKMIVRT